MNRDDPIGNGPIEMSMEEAMNTMAFALDRILNGECVANDPVNAERKNGFVLLVFPFGDESGRCNYISNGAKRTDIVRMFRAQIDQFEKQMAQETS